MQNHWTMKYRSQWPIFILRSNFRLYWHIIPNNNVHTSNSVQDIRQNHWTMEYRSQWPSFIFWSNIGSYWFILPKYDEHTSNSLQDIRQNHWTMKYRSCWPSLHDPQVHVTRLSHVRPIICTSCFHKRKCRKTLFKGILDFDRYPHPGHGPWGQESRNESRPSRVLMVQIWMLSDEWLVRYTPLEKL